MIDNFELDYAAIAAALTRQNEIDRDASGPKAPHGAINYHGVRIDSRWNILSEYRELRDIVDHLPDLMRIRIASIWCDSKCTASYIVAIKAGQFVPNLPGAVETAVIAAVGGHNGILIQSDGPEGDVFLDCNWGDPLEDACLN